VAGATYRFDLERRSGSTPLELDVFPGTPGGIYARSQAKATAVTDAGGHASVTYRSGVSGWHPIAVCRPTIAGGADNVTFDFHWLPASLASVGSAASGRLALTAVPNPAQDRCALAVAGGTREVSITVVDVTGRRVRSVVLPADATETGARRTWTWDCRSDEGRVLRDGLYWLVATSGTERESRLVVVMR
jgi:hypothetical protein